MPERIRKRAQMKGADHGNDDRWDDDSSCGAPHSHATRSEAGAGEIQETLERPWSVTLAGATGAGIPAKAWVKSNAGPVAPVARFSGRIR